MTEATGQSAGTGDPRQSTRLPVRAMLMLAGITLVWGTTYPAMKIAASEIPVFTFRGTIAVGAALIMFVLARLAGQSLRIPRGNRMGLVVAALFNTTGGHLLVAAATLFISAGQTALIMYTMPIWAFLIGIPILGERPTRKLLIGLLLGVSGIAVIAWQYDGDSWLSPGVLLVLGGAIAWGCGTVANKHIAWRMPMFVMTAWQFFIGGIPLCLVALLEIDAWHAVSTSALLAAAYIMGLPMIFGFWAFFRIIQMVPASVASLSVLAVPGVALLLGPLLVDEPITAIDLIAFALIAGALLTVLPLPNLRWMGLSRRGNR